MTFYKQFHVRHSHLENGQVLLFLQCFASLKNPRSFGRSLYIPSQDRSPLERISIWCSHWPLDWAQPLTELQDPVQGITQEKSYCFSRMLKTSKCEVMGIAEEFINPFSPEYHEQVKGAGEGMVFTWERSNTWLFIGWSQICSALIARQFKSCEKNAVQRRKKIQEGREEGKSKNKKSRSKEDYSTWKKISLINTMTWWKTEIINGKGAQHRKRHLTNFAVWCPVSAGWDCFFPAYRSQNLVSGCQQDPQAF